MLVCVMIIVLWFVLLWFAFPYILPLSNIRFRGRNTSKERKSSNSLHIFTFGDMSISNGVPSTHCLHVIAILVLLWLFCLLCLIDVSVLSNLVYSGSSLPKLAQYHKVSICITLMCMKISCWCTYCLQEGLMCMKLHFPCLHDFLLCI